MECVTWNKAMEFCKKLTVLEREAGCLPDGYEYTLPTEAQWEYAARGGNKSKGYIFSGGNNIAAVGWYYENSGNKRLDDTKWEFNLLSSNGCAAHPVGEKSPNELGFCDMSGNVWEWCRDSCGSSDSSAWLVQTDTYRDGVRDPMNLSGSQRVLRGGGWRDYARCCRTANRDSDLPTDSYILGFRVALAPSR